MVEFASSSLTIVSLVIFLSFIGAILSEKLKASYPTVIIVIGLALSFLRVGGAFNNISFDGNLGSVILGFVVP